MKNKRWILIIALPLTLVSLSMGKEELQGPLREVFRRPFVILYPYKLIEESPSLRETLNAFVSAVAPQTPGEELCKSEERLEKKDIREKNIILFTLFRDSSLIQRMRNSLPILIDDEKVSLGKRVYEGNVGLIMVVPNPLNPTKYFAIFGATTPGALRHIMDFKPCLDDPIDYLLFTTKDNETLKVEAGIFNKENKNVWRLYSGSMPLDKIRWENSPSKQYMKEGAIVSVEYLMACFPQEALIVYGTQGQKKDEEDYIRKQALLKQRTFAERMNVKIGIKADKEINEEELRSKNLELFGTPSNNSILNKIKDKLPIKFKDKYIFARFPYYWRMDRCNFCLP
ncbi:MAG: hypothetical protein ACPL7E_02360 [bacterium]